MAEPLFDKLTLEHRQDLAEQLFAEMKEAAR
jgi:hypothetical protein